MSTSDTTKFVIFGGVIVAVALYARSQKLIHETLNVASDQNIIYKTVSGKDNTIEWTDKIFDFFAGGRQAKAEKQFRETILNGIPKAPRYQLQFIPEGRAGIRKTLSIMGDLVEKYKVNPLIRELSLKIMQMVPGKQWTKEAAALQNWVRRHIRYVKDVRGVETVQSPVKTLQLKAGDCDDQATLLATFLEAAGHATRFVAVARKRGVFSHVYVEVKIGHQWLPVETTQNFGFGKFPIRVAERMEHHN